MPKFVVFEGIDGVGKTATATELAMYLQRKGEPVIEIPMPPPELASAAKYINQSATTKAHFMFYLSVVKLVSDQIKTLRHTHHVICSRYILSTMAYHIAAEVNVTIDLEELDLEKPDITVLLECKETVRQKRLAERGLKNPGDELSTTTSAYLRKVSKLFLQIEKNVFSIDTTNLSIQETVEEVYTSYFN